MRITDLSIQNFRGIRRASLTGLGNTIIIAGQNGSGKSCVFDAIRLLKSVYGGYQQNEWHHWMGEFAINVNSPSQDLASIFNQRADPVSIKCEFDLHDREKSYLMSNVEELLIDSIWRQELPEAYSYSGYRMAMFASQFREREPAVRQKAQHIRPQFEAELARSSITGALSVQPGGRMNIAPSLVLPVLFTSYKPQEIGVIDYHGAQRHYGRETVQNVNISLDQNSQVQSSHALYNYANKYANVKSEMAASYMKEILAEQAGVPRASQSTLTNTLKELFETFFPDKRFLGPIPTADGGLSFPVETGGGTRHDLDDLSAGEKEILYGYLRIRNSAPRYSIILVDEPELHLNPRLIRGLPEFYRKNLGRALDNQIWLVSHSDALLREAVGKDGFNVFHMQPCSLVSQETGIVGTNLNQLKPLEVKSDVDLAVTDLVGDLAAFQPDKRVVIFEGGGDTDFDRWMTTSLFPDFAARQNLISGSNKNKVRALHEVLNRAYGRGDISTRFFAIVDRDYEGDDEPQAVGRFSWPVYHIENFLLDPGVLAITISGISQNVVSEEEVVDKLKACARSTVAKAIRHKVLEHANRAMGRALELRTNPTADNVAASISAAVSNAIDRVNKLPETALSLSELQSFESTVRSDVERAFADGSWMSLLPGRDILRAYANDLGRGVSHEMLRVMIVNKMADMGHRPAGMADVLNRITEPPKAT